jgi:hypothetical protein
LRGDLNSLGDGLEETVGRVGIRQGNLRPTWTASNQEIARVIQKGLGNGGRKGDNGTGSWGVMGKGRLRFRLGFGVRLGNLNKANGVYSQGWKFRGGKGKVEVRKNWGRRFRRAGDRRDWRERRGERNENSPKIRRTRRTDTSNTGEARGTGRSFKNFLWGVYYRRGGFGFTFGKRFEEGGGRHGRHGWGRDNKRISKSFRNRLRDKDRRGHGQDGRRRRRIGIYYCRSRFGFTNGKGVEDFR